MHKEKQVASELPGVRACLRSAGSLRDGRAAPAADAAATSAWRASASTRRLSARAAAACRCSS